MKKELLGFFLIALLGWPGSSALAYTDDVQARIDEAWQAVEKVLTPVGIYKKDEKKKYMQSRWMEDEVIRKNHLFKDITSQAYRRRYRMKVYLTEAGENIQIRVTGEFEQKPKQSPVTAPWRKLKPQMEDYDLERAFFMRILAQMAKARG